MFDEPHAVSGVRWDPNCKVASETLQNGHILVAYQTVHFSKSSSARKIHAAVPKNGQGGECTYFPVAVKAARRGRYGFLTPRTAQAETGSLTARTARRILEGPDCFKVRPACLAVRPVVSTSSTRTTETPSRFAPTRKFLLR